MEQTESRLRARQQQRPRNGAIDVAKIIGALLVVMNHTSLTMKAFDGHVTPVWLSAVGLFFVVKIGVPLFILSTGHLVLNKVRSYTYSGIRAGKFAGLLVLWSYFYWALSKPEVPLWRLDQFLLAVYQGPVATHLWYLYMLVCFYLMLPFISRLVSTFKRRDFHAFMLGWLILGALPLTISNYGGPGLTGWAHLELFVGFIGYFICGQYLARYPISTWLAGGMLVVGMAVSVAATAWLSVFHGEVYPGTDNVMLVPNVLAAVGAYVLIMKAAAHVQSRTVTAISQLTFGVYLVHFALVDLLEKQPMIATMITQSHGYALLGVQLALDLMVFTLSLIVTFALIHLPLMRKLVS